MKKTILSLSAIALLAGGFIGTGCKKSSNNNNNNNNSNSIVGNWEARSESIKVTVAGFTTNTDSTYAAGQGDYVEYRSNGTYIEKDNYSASSVNDSGSYTLFNNNSKIAFNSSTSSTKDTADISISSNDFTLSTNESYSQGGITYSETASEKFVRR